MLTIKNTACNRTKQPQGGSTRQKGFTLVELAIALMVIGLLLGGVLKGEELVENARLVSIHRQVKSYITATTMFEVTYKLLPGDIQNPGLVVPNCTSALCTASGNRDGFIRMQSWYLEMDETGSTGANESRRFWLHLAKAGLITGIDVTEGTSSPFRYGTELPAASVENAGFIVHGVSLTTPFEPQTGNIIILAVRSGSGGGALSARQAATIDRKMDDGLPFSGSVLSGNSWLNCTTNATAAAQYNEQVSEAACNMGWVF